MELPNSYFQLLPGDLRKEIKILITPYPEILELCGDFCDDKNFWIVKAATDVDEDPNDPEFRKFFDLYYAVYRDQYIYVYLLILALDGMAVRGIGTGVASIERSLFGSEMVLFPGEMLAYGIVHKDQKLIDYTMNVIISGTYLNINVEVPLIIEILANGEQITRLINYLKKLPENSVDSYYLINYAKLRFSGVPEEEIIALQEACDHISTPLIKQIYHDHIIRNDKNYEVMNGIVPKDPLYKNFKTAIIYGQDDIAEELLEKFNFEVYGEDIQAYIVTKNIKKLNSLKGDFRMCDLNYKELAETDSPEIFDLLYKKVADIIEKTRHKLKVTVIEPYRIIGLALKYAKYGTKLFAYLLAKFKEYQDIPVKELVIYKSYMDFAGLATIYQQASKSVKDSMKENFPLGYPVTTNILRMNKVFQ